MLTMRGPVCWSVWATSVVYTGRAVSIPWIDSVNDGSEDISKQMWLFPGLKASLFAELTRAANHRIIAATFSNQPVVFTMNELVLKAIAGDTEAEKEVFEELLTTFRFLVRRRLRWVSHEDSEDIAQDACRTVFEKYRSIDFSEGFAQWSYGVLRMKIGNALKKHRRDSKDSRAIEDIPLALGAENPNPGFKIALEKCFRVLLKSHARYARILNLSYQGYDTADICSRMGVTAQNCYSTLNRARSHLMSCLQEAGGAV